ncbi:MAG: isoleucine--tRNA ligase [Microgenomates group bacterium]
MINFNQLEEKILNFWEQKKIFEKTLKRKKGQKSFVFYEGPPTANGKPGIHHVLARIIKDLFPRYKTMQGYYCLRKGGWDTHGLPVELEIEKELGISGKKQIEEYGIAKFNQKCRESVFRYVEEWEKLTKRIGFWIDMEHPYVTCDRDYIESCWWLLKEIWKKGWLYKDYKVVPYCYRCETPLSSHEVAQGYKDVTENSLYVKFPVKGKNNLYFLAWTTTPWTLLGNVALAVNPQAVYVRVTYQNEDLILAEERLKVLGSKSNYQVKEKFLGKDILGWEYLPVFDFVKYQEKVHFVTAADFVSLEEGTGIVHTAVMYGEEDFDLGVKIGLPKHHVVTPEGVFTPECGKFAGKKVKEADKEIIEDLEKRNLLLKVEPVTHAYPFCWRCHSPLLYYAIDSWYIKTTAVKEALIRENNKTNWVPAYIKRGRMGNWLATLIDWSLSRKRYWGTPLPIWECQNCGYQICIGSFQEIKKLGGKVPEDPHRPFIDEVTFLCPKCKEKMKRVNEVIDCWFDSGAMPVAQWHYPFENKEIFKDQFPADFIAEAMDQTRGWFFTLLAVSTLVFDQNSYKNVVCTGLVLDDQGRKMSKHIGNVVDPWEAIRKTGVDAIRWYFYSSTQVGNNYRFSIRLVEDSVKRFILPLWNVFNFYKVYSQVDGFKFKENVSLKKENILDQWIIANLNKLIKEVTNNLDKFHSYQAVKKIEKFVDDLSLWYVRRSRERVGPVAKNEKDKKECYETLGYVLLTLSKILAPFIPFLSEEFYQNILFGEKKYTSNKSVHLEKWPKGERVNEKLLKEMESVRKICEVAHGERKKLGIKVRQPLKKLIIKDSDFYKLISEVKWGKALLELLKEELNVKEIELKSGKGEVKFDTEITPQLKEEGEVRELIRQIQELRKKAKCRLDQKIEVVLPWLPQQPKLRDYLKEKVIAKSLKKGKELKIIPL